MRIAGSARKHGVDDRDIDHAVRYPVRTALITDPETGEVRHLYIGADRTGQLLEIVIVRLFEDDPTVIHAMPARPKFL